MAPIREYNDPYGKQGLQPSSAGPNSQRELGTAVKENAGITARAIGGALDGVGQAIDRFAANRKKADDAAGAAEISAGGAAFGAWALNQSDGWDEASNGDDPSAAGGQYLGKMVSDGNSFVEGFKTTKGREWAQTKVNDFLLAQQKSIHADVARKSGDNAVANLETYTNTQAALAESNPDQLDSILAGVGNDVSKVFPPSATGAAVDKAKAEATNSTQKAIAQRGLEGMARKNPEQFLKDFQDGKFSQYGKYGVDYNKAVSEARSQITFNRDGSNADAGAKAKATKAASDKAQATILSSTIGPDGKTQVVTSAQLKSAKDAITQFPDQQQDWQNFYTYLNKLATGDTKATNDPKTQAGFTARMNTDLTAQEVYDAVANGKLEPGQGNIKNPGASVYLDAIKLRAEKGDPLGQTADRNAYDLGLHLFDVPFNALPSNKPGENQAQMDRQNDYRTWYANTFSAWQKAGISTHDMITPGSPNYLPDAYMKAHPEYKGTLALPSTPVPLPPNAAPSFGKGGVQPQSAPPAPPAGSPAAAKPAAPAKLPPLDDNVFNNAGVNKVSYQVPQNVQQDIYAAVGGVQSSIGVPVPDTMPSGNSIASIAVSGEKDPIKLASLMVDWNESDDRTAISDFIKKTAGLTIDPKSTAWCAAWVNGVLAATGYQTSVGKGNVGNGLWAFDFEKVGTDTMSAPSQGDVVVYRWKDGGGHVGFYMGTQTINGKQYIATLGGNQGGDKMKGGGVSISLEPADQVSAIRRIPKQGTVAA